MKHSIPRETRAKLAELLFQMTFMPGLDTALMDAWAATCTRLIRCIIDIILSSFHLLLSSSLNLIQPIIRDFRKSKYLGPEDLVLPWKPLYDAIDWYLFPNTRQKSLLADSYVLIIIIWKLEKRLLKEKSELN